ncbi:MAG TPA: hypothetical protein PKZ84_06625 [Anaerolineae bacterium]|nr:hypothetical protein [Anaerolineae bacterium]HQI83361.1 hypothetical protein [Anaerolineae bacterium]
MKKKTRSPQTDEDLVQAFANLFDAIEPETPSEIDAVLLEAGYNPDNVAARIQAFAEKALAESPLNWRNQAEVELQAANTRIERFKASVSIPRTREGIIEAIKRLTNQLKPQARFAQAYFRNFESVSDQDLIGLLTELQYLAAEQNTPASEEK